MAGSNGAPQALSIYLKDHHAAARAGTALAQRFAKSATNAVDPDEAADLAGEIADDLKTLESVMEAHGVAPSRAKDGLALAAERLARLKPNGHLLRRSQLSDVIEAETLVVGITGKEALWKTLALVDENGAADYDSLISRAQAQRATMAKIRDAVSERTFER
jgi:hypothetical protein